MPRKSGLEILSFESPEAWEKWLALNHAHSKGLWLKIFKKSSGKATVAYPEALEGALCYGWIDGQKAPCDAESWLQRFTPRGVRSSWSKRNTEHAERLIRAGRMKPAGAGEVDAAKKDGRWKKAYQSQGTASYPKDFLREVEKNPRAKAFLGTLDSANRYAIIYRLGTAKKPGTREKRLRQFIEMLAQGRKLHE